MKRCYKCGDTKPLTEFNKNQSRCRDCDKKKNAAYRATHREYFRLKAKERYDPSLNPERYASKRDDYLRRRKAYSESVRGKFMGLLNSAKTRADKLAVLYELDIDWLMGLYEAQNKCCLLTGIELKFETGNSRVYKPYSPSLDRIDPAKGYTKENTRLVCTHINIALNQFGDEAFRHLAEAYLKHNLVVPE